MRFKKVVTAAGALTLVSTLIYPVIFTLWKWHREVKPEMVKVQS